MRTREKSLIVQTKFSHVQLHIRMLIEYAVGEGPKYTAIKMGKIMFNKMQSS